MEKFPVRQTLKTSRFDGKPAKLATLPRISLDRRFKLQTCCWGLTYARIKRWSGSGCANAMKHGYGLLVSARKTLADHILRRFKKACTYKCDHLFGIVVTSDCHPRGPGFESRLYPRNFSSSVGSGTGSTQPREDNWVATWMRSSEIRLRKLKLRLRDKRFANHKAPRTAIWQQPLQSVLALRGCSATDLINV